MEFETWLPKFLKNEVSNKDITSLATKLNVNLSNIHHKCFSKRKRTVLRELLRQILQTIDQNDDAKRAQYQKILEETEAWLNTTKVVGYQCTYAGCSYVGKEHSKYVSHLTNSHFTDSDVLCNFKKQCKRRFKNLGELKSHIETSHHGPADDQEEDRAADRSGPSFNLSSDPTRCIMMSCGQQIFPNIRKLLTHINVDHHLEPRVCCFEDCEEKFPKKFFSRNHFGSNHTGKNAKGSRKLKSEYCLTSSGTIRQINDNPNMGDGGSEEHEIVEPVSDDSMEVEGNDQNDNPGEETSSNHKSNIIHMMADFLNRLTVFKMVPQVTVNEIVSEWIAINSKAKQLQQEAVKEAMKLDSSIKTSTMNRVLAALEMDPTMDALHCLDTTYKREKYVFEHFKLVPPVEIILNAEDMKNNKAKKESYQYIPLIDSMKTLLEDPTFIDMIEREKDAQLEADSEDVVYQDIGDGHLRKSSSFFIDNPEALTGFIYSDEIEVVNPLGAGRGKSKLLELYWSLGEIPKRYRSQVDRIGLSIVIQSKLLKKYGYSKCYEPLINDMLALEKGITIDKPFRRTVKVGFMLHLGDNLESHSVGGFSACFSSRDICRVCHIQHSDLQSKIHDYISGPHKYWSQEEYDNIVDTFFPEEPTTEVDNQNLRLHLFDEVEEPGDQTADVDNTDIEDFEEDGSETEEEGEDNDEEENNMKQHGLTQRCPFNKLSAFHAVDSFPPDFLHDFLEGSLSEDLLSSIKILSHKKYFTETMYNNTLDKINFNPYDKPEKVNLKSNNKLKGKALSILSHIRYFGVIIRKLKLNFDTEKIFEENSYKLVIMLARLSERLMAPAIREYEVETLNEDIINYLDLRRKLYEDNEHLMTHAKPKHHFASHYGDAIVKYGPPVGVWTARFESKNRVAKMMSISAKNYKNIAKTVAVRQQFRMASVFYKGIFDTEEKKVILPVKVRLKMDLDQSSPIHNKLREFMDNQSVLMNEICLDGQKYKCDDVIVTKIKSSNHIEVGLIKAIMFNNEDTFFVVKLYDALRDTNLNLFETLNYSEDLNIVNSNQICDYKPLVRHGTDIQFYFALHHHLSVKIND